MLRIYLTIALPTLPFNPEFLDDRFARAYRAEARLGTTVGVFASLAMFVTCLGVFGLGSFTSTRRTISAQYQVGAATTCLPGLSVCRQLGNILTAARD